ncbi:glycine hydroxymethyltransferase [Embleya sp. NPDC005575]|uniref:glycine hydroxymethyltransferase n=1 Tax=Embleya sp. NPDC005575 TaxID=3156892 RepID=UPI0033A9CABD
MHDQPTSLLERYLGQERTGGLDPAAVAVIASLDHLRQASPVIASGIARELQSQRTNLKLIASENYSSLSVQLAQGNLLTDKYAEGVPGHRFYAGCDNVDDIEAEAARLACELFGADHAYVQPHSGADANLVAFHAILHQRVERPFLEKAGVSDVAKLGDDDWAELRRQLGSQRLLGLDYYSGGHLTHGYRHNASARLFEAHSYAVDPETKRLDMAEVRERAHAVKPLVLLAGYSAYSRRIDFAQMRAIADEVGAVFMVDMAHFAGLVAGKAFTGDHDPVRHAHVVTSTTHKTLRGPRGGLVLCTQEFAESVDKGCPAVLGGPLPHAIAAKAVAFQEALSADFADYAAAVVRNAQALASALVDRGASVLTGGTDNHLVLVDVAASWGLTGRQAESALRECGITLNRNSLPFDVNGPWYTSGLRLGTPALTTLGMGPAEMAEIADILCTVLAAVHPRPLPSDPTATSKAKYDLADDTAQAARKRVSELLGAYPLYPSLDADLIAEVAVARG